MKKWFLLGKVGGSAYLHAAEMHAHCLQTAEDMRFGRTSTSGLHFCAAVFNSAHELGLFTQHASDRVTPLGHVHGDAGAPLPDEVVEAMAGYGVVKGDCIRVATKKLIARCGVHTLALDEL